MRTLVFSLFLSVTVVSLPYAHAQNTKSASVATARTAASPAAKLPQTATAPAAFNAAGLQNEDDFLHIYSGDFGQVRIHRNSTQFYGLMNVYMLTFADQCKASLPPNKVQITELVCVKTSQLVNRNTGAPVGEANCVEHKSVNTGKFADPALYTARNKTADAAAKQIEHDQMAILSGRMRNPLDMVTNLTAGTQAMNSDVGGLFRNNACGSPGMKEFQTNLIRFANGESDAPATGQYKENGYPPLDTNYTRLLDDLVAEASHSWTKNRYWVHSMVNGTPRSFDSAGRPTKVTSSFNYYVPPNGQLSEVTVTFKAGVPECLYFEDDPQTCRTPSPRVVSDYAHKKYATEYATQ